MDLDLTVSYLAQGHFYRRGDDLGLTIAQCGDDSCLDNASSDELTVSDVCNGSLLPSAGNSNDGNGLALLGPVAVVQIVEVTREALVESRRVTQCQDVVLAEGEAAGDEGTGLGRTIELELVVGCDIPSSVFCVVDRSVRQTNNEDTVLATRSPFLLHLSVKPLPPWWMICPGANCFNGSTLVKSTVHTSRFTSLFSLG